MLMDHVIAPALRDHTMQTLAHNTHSKKTKKNKTKQNRKCANKSEQTNKNNLN